MKRLTRMSLLTALALIIFTLEAQIPSLVPIPGVKLGLANIITVYAIFRLSPRDTLMILLCRVFLGSVFSGQMVTLAYSLSGGLLCYLAMLGMKKLVTDRQIWVCSVVGAMAHNIGQILAAIAIARTPQLLIYLPVLLISGILTGLITGLAAQYTIEHLRKLSRH